MSRYRIVVLGDITEPIEANFPGLETAFDGGRSIVVGPVRDQCKLHAILAVIRDLNAPLLTIDCLDWPRAHASET